METESFREKYWEKQVLLVQREDPSYFSDLLTLDDVDLLLFSLGVNLDGIRVLTEGKEMPVSELEHLSGQNGRVTVLETLYQLYRTGSTIALNALEPRWEPLSRLSAELSAETSARVQTNVYLTPGGGAQGLSPHYDTHDVCVLQVHGVKRWSLYGTAHELPLRDQPFDHSKVFEREVEQEIDLKPGDVLYLPRGTVHAATSTDSASVHITVGFRPLLWNAVIQEAVNAVLGDDVRFRTGRWDSPMTRKRRRRPRRP
ncbi:cupin domain-containing protein [Streptomyces sp. CEV 2-1]|uniref:cupin domain-containing protein n=1 Tax=Streptomyces sp. CEV 2-1 TaxID=2485153 RepID=UPI001610A5D0|nr:cupin domain-containing protein [Streptomyces sp. CEV 2-1]